MKVGRLPRPRTPGRILRGDDLAAAIQRSAQVGRRAGQAEQLSALIDTKRDLPGRPRPRRVARGLDASDRAGTDAEGRRRAGDALRRCRDRVGRNAVDPRRRGPLQRSTRRGGARGRERAQGNARENQVSSLSGSPTHNFAPPTSGFRRPRAPPCRRRRTATGWDMKHAGPCRSCGPCAKLTCRPSGASR